MKLNKWCVNTKSTKNKISLFSESEFYRKCMRKFILYLPYYIREFIYLFLFQIN